jgi:hypothetical protein
VLEAWETAGEMMADKRIGLLGVLCQVGQFGIGRTVDPPSIGERLGKMLLAKSKNFLLVVKLFGVFSAWRLCPR